MRDLFFRSGNFGYRRILQARFKFPLLRPLLLIGGAKVTVLVPAQLMFNPDLTRQFALRLGPLDYRDALFAYGGLLFDLFESLLIYFLLLQLESLLLDIELIVHAFPRFLGLLGLEVPLTLILKLPAFLQEVVADGFCLVGIGPAIFGSAQTPG